MNSEEELDSLDSDGFTDSEAIAAFNSAKEPEKPLRKLTNNPEIVRSRTHEMDHIPRTPLKDKYEFLSVLGAGGAGVIYKAKQQPLGRLVAVKMIHSHLMTPIAVKRFQQEATTIGRISHANIISVYDFGISEENQPFMVMDYVEGTPLSDVLDQEGQLSVEKTKSIAKQLCDGLAHAHSKGILHRDLKPSNIMMVKSEHGDDVAKILDFGLAKIIFGDEGEDEQEHLTKTGETVGTPAFMSPEQVMGKSLDSRSDVYALGCVMYHCLTGEPPFVGDTKMETMLMHLNSTPEPINPTTGEPLISPYLEMVILKCLEKHPEDRFESMSLVKAAIEATDKGLFLTPETAQVAGAAPLAPKRKTLIDQPLPVTEVSTSNEDKTKQPQTTKALLVVLIIIGVIACSLAVAYIWVNAYPSSDSTVVKKKKKTKSKSTFDEDSWYDDAFKARIGDTAHHVSAYHDPEITDKGLKALEHCDSLRSVDLSQAHKITEKGIAHLKGDFIQILNLKQTKVNDDVGECLIKIVSPDGKPSLVDLNLSATHVTDEIVSSLKLLPKLEVIDLSANNITDAGVEKLAKTRIKRLNLSKTMVGDDAMDSIASIPSLVYLNLTGTQVTDAGVKKLLALTELQELSLDETRVSDESLKGLAGLKNLSVLKLAKTDISDKSLPIILKCPQLAYVNISGCMRITPKGANDFRHEMAKEGRTAEKNESTGNE